MKKLAGLVRFQFYKPKTKKTNRTWTQKNKTKKSQTGKNQAKPVWTSFCPKKPNQTKTGRFGPVSVLKKISVWLLFLYKNRIEPKIITPNRHNEHPYAHTNSLCRAVSMNFFTSDMVITYYHKLMMRTILFPNYFYFFSIH